MRGILSTYKVDPSTRSSNEDQRVYESLQGSPEVCPLATPRRYHDIVTASPHPAPLPRGERERYSEKSYVSMPSGFTDVSPVFTLPLLAEATLVDRTRVRKRLASGYLHA